MKRFWKISLAVLLIMAVSAPVFAWEFTLTGEHEYRWRYWSRTGNADLFGLAGAAETTGMPVGFAGPNMWGNGAVVPVPAVAALPPLPSWPTGVPGPYPPGGNTLITRGGFSRWGSDALYVDQRLTFVPTIRVNEAIRVHGVYNVGGYRNMYAMWAGADPQLGGGVGMPPFERYMPMYTSGQSAQSTAGVGSWEQVRATVQVPWGILSYGMKDFPFGVGLFTTQRLRGSSFVFVVPYGPMRFIGAIWELSSGTNGLQSYNFRPDGTNKNTWFGALAFTYDAGPLAVSGLWLGRNWHNQSTNTSAAMAGPGPPIAVIGSLGNDDILNLFSFAMKYNTGRFFANAGYDWYTRDFYALKPRGGATAGAVAPIVPFMMPGAHQEAYHLMAEVGMFSGPSKVSLMWAQSSGPVMNDNSVGYAGLGYNQVPAPFGRNPLIVSGFNPKQYVPWGIDWQTMAPYQYLMFGVYGGGNQSFTGLFVADDTKGNMSDAVAFAGRVDYAVASNLNVYGTYLWAHRLENYGTFMGQWFSDGTLATAAQRNQFRTNIGAFDGTWERYVPDGHLGWEITLGADWKLLEGLTVRTRYAYWQPGNWFQYAYQAIMPDQAPVAGQLAIAGGHAYSASGFLGGRDAIQAFEGSLTIDF